MTKRRKNSSDGPTTFFYVRRRGGAFVVEDEDGDHSFGPFDTKKEAEKFRATMEGRRRNPHLLTIGNPAPDVAAAIRAYKRFHGVEPAPGAIKYGDGNGVLIALGELSRIDYRPRKGERRGPIWFHHFKPGCVLCTDPAGRRLVVLDRHGKRLVDFDRGIIR